MGSISTDNGNDSTLLDNLNDDVFASDDEDDWEAINQPPTFLENISAIDPVLPATAHSSETAVALQDIEFYSDTLEAPLDLVQNDLELFEDAVEYIFYDAEEFPGETPLMQLWEPDTFIYANDNIICGIRQCFFNLTRYIGKTDTIAFEGYSPVDGGADTIFCGKDC